MAQTQIMANALGVPARETDDGFADIELLMGDVPPNGAPLDVALAASAVFPLFAVVGFTGNVPTGTMALATADGAVEAVGVLMVPVAIGAVTGKSARIHTSGHFNINRLQWDASFDTPAKKLAAFTPGVSNILLGRNPWDPTFS